MRITMPNRIAFGQFRLPVGPALALRLHFERIDLHLAADGPVLQAFVIVECADQRTPAGREEVGSGQDSCWPVAGMTRKGKNTPLYAVSLVIIMVGVFAFFAVLLRLV